MLHVSRLNTICLKVPLEIQFAAALPADRTAMVENVQQMIKTIGGKFETVEEATRAWRKSNNVTDETVTTYIKPTFSIETPARGEIRCADCIKFLLPNTCPNDLLSLMKTGYAHSKRHEWVEIGGKTRDSYEVSVGSTVDLFCQDYIKKPKEPCRNINKQ